MKTFFSIIAMLVSMVAATSAATTPDYLCFSLPKATSIRNIVTSKIAFKVNGTLTSTPKLQYSKDLSTWTSYAFGDEISVASGESVYFRATVSESLKDALRSGKNATFCNDYYSNYIQFTSTGTIYASGSIMSLLDATCKQTSVPEGAFASLFKDCKKLKTAPKLPATTLGERCYQNMFSACTSLTAAPELPATVLAEYCYSYMFHGCSSLTTAPELPAMTLAGCCYDNMFRECSSLNTAPALPATALSKYCYSGMFESCSSLTTAPALPATTLCEYCYSYMFCCCTKLTTAPELPATELAKECYYWMFYQCRKITSLKVRFTDWATDDKATDSWVYLLPEAGTFFCPSSLIQKTGEDYIPKGWTVKDIDNPTGIKEVHSAELVGHSSDAYNLAGQRVGANAKGIIIKNGKKYLK